MEGTVKYLGNEISRKMPKKVLKGRVQHYHNTMVIPTINKCYACNMSFDSKGEMISHQRIHQWLIHSQQQRCETVNRDENNNV